jgi:hypothetical protein
MTLIVRRDDDERPGEEYGEPVQRRIDALGEGVSRNQDVADVATAAVLFAVCLAVASLGGSDGLGLNTGPLTLTSTILIGAQTLPIAVRRRYPVPVLITTGVAIGIYGALGYQEAGGNFGVLIALYTVAAHTTGVSSAVWR